MKIIQSPEQYSPSRTPIALTIGNFDAVHLGHQALLRKLKECGGESVVLSFSNHPAEVLRPDFQVTRITTLEHKIQLLEEQGIDVLILLTFSKQLSQMSAEEFILWIRRSCPFTDLILGHDAVLGKDRHGNAETMQALAEAIGFRLFYVDAQKMDGALISSSHIRSLIQKGALSQAEKLLGRRYSILTTIQTGQGLGKRIGFPTINVHVDGLCLPPYGVYAVDFYYNKTRYPGVANLGIAPTVRHDHHAILEVHLLDTNLEVEQGKTIEVVFRGYLRPEIKFASLDELKAQIAKDVETARKILQKSAPRGLHRPRSMDHFFTTEDTDSTLGIFYMQ